MNLNDLFDRMVASEFSEYFWFDARELEYKYSENSIIYYKDNAGFITDSLMCEYGYVFNLDNEVLEYYVGFQNESQNGNRYGEQVTYTTDDGKGYYPCRLAATFSFRYLRNTLTKVIVDNMEKASSESGQKIYDIDTDARNDEQVNDPDLKTSMILVSKKLDWIEKQIASTLDKHIDMRNRYEQGLRDIDRIKTEMNVYRMEIDRIQRTLEEVIEKSSFCS